MPHYSEMEFLFNNVENKNEVIAGLSYATVGGKNYDRANLYNLFKPNLIAYKVRTPLASSTTDIKNYIKTHIYDKETSVNPYIKLLRDFNTQQSSDSTKSNPGAGLRIRASDLAYLRDLGVYPINRMAILRRFPEGTFVPENLEEQAIEPIACVIGWIPPDKVFSTVTVSENWTTTPERLDQVLAEIIRKTIGLDLTKAIPLPEFSQGMLFEFYKRMGSTNQSNSTSVDEDYEYYNTNGDTGTNNSNVTSSATAKQPWGLSKIPIGDPNVLQEGPFRDPVGQNIKSEFSFDLETIYEQKLIGDVDPGSAMLDCLENIYAIGTSNMAFYWGDGSPLISKAIAAASGNAGGGVSNLDAWWIFVKDIMINFWDVLTQLFASFKAKLTETEQAVVATAKSQNLAAAAATAGKQILTDIEKLLPTILTTTIAINRFKLRGSIELMVGGRMSSTPWHLTLGNPYSPWINTSHIVVKSVTVETSSEMGFNDQPQWLKATIKCQFSRSLGKQELMRMFNNTYRRNYNLKDLFLQGKPGTIDPNLNNNLILTSVPSASAQAQAQAYDAARQAQLADPNYFSDTADTVSTTPPTSTASANGGGANNSLITRVGNAVHGAQSMGGMFGH